MSTSVESEPESVGRRLVESNRRLSVSSMILPLLWANAVPSHVPLMHASNRLSYAAVSVSIPPAFYQISVLTDDQIAYNEK